jgi:predicted helicase
LTVTEYLKTLEKELAAGNATEHTHRSALKTLIESLADKITATNEPQRIKCGAPDYIVTRSQIPLGYIEAKDVDVSLDTAEKTEQLARYRESLGNLILTDYLEFRWYVRPKPSKADPFPESEHRLSARLARVGPNGKLRLEKDGEQQVTELLKAFLNADVPTVQSAKELAVRMAALARLIRDTIRRALVEEEESGTLHQQMSGFREVLLHDLTEEQFADMYAQTICYGLFAARCNAKGSEHFTREHAAYDLPKTNPFLRKMFNHIAGPELDERIAWAVDDLAELLHRADISAILQDFGKRTRQEDPVVHFYETFLAAYDPKMREARGVYYTPEPAVSYIVRSVDHILKTDFKLADGLADSSKISIKSPDGKGKTDVHRVLILDPATGTGTFLYGVINHIFESFKKNRGMWSGYVSEHLLPRLFGFELLMAPYAVAHMKLGLLLDQTRYDFQADERLRVYLTNTLEEAHEVSKLPLFTQWLAEEANEASKVKQEAPVMVVIGNPPYSGKSNNPNEKDTLINSGAKYIHGWEVGLNGRPVAIQKTALRASTKKQPTFIGRLMWDYFVTDGKRLEEKNPKWVNNDYVKFLRFAQWRIEKTGYGVLAFITDNSYLDSPTFRGMRENLLETFDDVYVLNLHGNSKKKERAPDGSKDENVFDITQGVAISIFIKKTKRTESPTSRNENAIVRHADLWGTREVNEENPHGEKTLSGGKYFWLWGHDTSNTTWTELEPQSPFYLFVPQDMDLRSEYEDGWKVSELMPKNNMGITTGNDAFATAHTAKELLDRISLLAGEAEDEQIRATYKLNDSSSFSLQRARKWARTKEAEASVVPIAYRCYDERYVIYSPAILARAREDISIHQINRENRSLVTFRAIREIPWRHSFVADLAIAKEYVSSLDNCFAFPLYLYRTEQPLFEQHSDAPLERRANLTLEFVAEFATRLEMTFLADGKGDRKETFGPEDVFDYMYAVFHSPSYRSRYAQFLKMDFPRLPLTSDNELFRDLCALGSELVGLHLREQHAHTITTYPIVGENEVDKVRYTAPGEGGSERGRVWINREQYFEGVPPEVWNFHVGGYQVCQKWLKDRKGRKLTYDDLTHYQHIVSALNETIRLMSEIDAVIDAHGGWPLTKESL